MDKPEKEKQTPGQQQPEKEVQAPQPSQSSEEKANDDEEDNGFDFGGLPNRNLKKNLGCG